MCLQGAFSSAERRERLNEYVSHLILDLLAVRIELRREQQRARTELEGLRDLLDRARPLLVSGGVDADLATLHGEIADALARRAP